MSRSGSEIGSASYIIEDRPWPGGGCALVTGATGLLGSHLAERLRARGDHVRALVRTNSRTDFLDALGVEIVRGDLTDPAACARPSAGVDRSSTARRRSVIGEGGASFKPAAWTRPRRWRGRPCGGRRPLSSYQLDQRVRPSRRSEGADR